MNSFEIKRCSQGPLKQHRNSTEIGMVCAGDDWNESKRVVLCVINSPALDSGFWLLASADQFVMVRSGFNVREEVGSG